MAREIELKLSLPKRSVSALRRHPLLAASAQLGRAVTLDNVYHDTPDLALRKAGVAVRVRLAGRRRLQTVKASSVSTAGLTSRPEWEQPWAGAFDFSDIDDARIRALLERHATALVPVFSTRFRRTTYRYTPAADTEILLMIDSGEIVAGEQRQPLCELELELVRGDALDLMQLGARLAEDLPLLPDDRSKAERGYRLHSGKPPRPLRAEASTITPDMDPLQAFRALAFSCLRQWQANAAGALDHQGPEFIHQLRVSQRRLRSLMRIFRGALPAEFAADWSARLKNNAERFGEARDLDVLEEELLAPVATWSPGDAARLERLRGAVAEARWQARAQAEKALDAAEQGRLLLALAEALMCLTGNDLIDSVDLRGFAALQLERLRKRVRRRHRAATDRAPEHLHALRIAFKQLRYGVEFFAPLLPRKAMRDYVAALARTQSALGFIHDLDIARARFEVWAMADAQLDAAAAYVCGWHGPRYGALTEAALHDSRALLKADKVPWAKMHRSRAT